MIVYDQERKDWLKMMGAVEADVRTDDDIGEYILQDTDNGNPGEDGYVMHQRKVYLPER